MSKPVSLLTRIIVSDDALDSADRALVRAIGLLTDYLPFGDTDADRVIKLAREASNKISLAREALTHLSPAVRSSKETHHK